ncbi:MAG: hypothetical protein KZQ90_09195 [Candidatus Thiodiazotropha sp. (ex Codakia rugifera)]|nr:hypothetical protein [Candidatus Thiodiazotropha sp. (ex Codakia rugifera)]
MNIYLRLIGIIGLSLFAMLFWVTFGVPDAVEESAKGFVKSQIEKEVREKYTESKASAFADKALQIAGNLGYEEQRIRSDLNNKLPEKIASVIAEMCGYDCEKKKAVAQSIASGYMERIANLQVAQQKLGSIIKGKYMEIVSNLRTDLRIFLGSNAVMFLILLFLSFLKPKAISHLFLPGVFLLVSTIVASAIYMFGQDWFYTILYNDYMGFGYLAYIGVIFGFFMDVAFNKGRVTTEIINGILNAIGSALSVAPC